MHFNKVLRTTAALIFCAAAAPTWAINHSIPGIHGDVSRSLLGDGTGVVVGMVDSGVDDTHPALLGNDSLGNPRLLAEQNFVTYEPGNTGDDIAGHGTAVGSVILSSDPVYTGFVPDARYINARVLDNNAGFNSDDQVRNGIGFAIDHGANVLNLSMNYFAQLSSGTTQFDLMIDWAAYARGISSSVSVGNISQGPGTNAVRGPGSAYNGISVGRVINDLSKVSIDSAGAYTEDGRMKPDVVGPGTLITAANNNWESGNLWRTGLSGTSLAVPHVTGLIAQELEAGATHGLSTDPLIVKATIMNSATKNVLGRTFQPWAPGDMTDVVGVATTTHPLDPQSGAGLIDGQALAHQYLAGEMGPGPVGDVGWDLNSIANGATSDFTINHNLIAGSQLTATLTWYRHVGRNDNGNGVVDANDNFFQSQALSNLDLEVLRNGVPIAASLSTVDNVEHLNVSIDQLAQYTVRVLGTSVFGASEEFAVAWSGTAVPEPTGLLLAVAGGVLLACQRWRLS
jgi:Subtilase family